jgi:hypothetical protein
MDARHHFAADATHRRHASGGKIKIFLNAEAHAAAATSGNNAFRTWHDLSPIFCSADVDEARKEMLGTVSHAADHDDEQVAQAPEWTEVPRTAPNKPTMKYAADEQMVEALDRAGWCRPCSSGAQRYAVRLDQPSTSKYANAKPSSELSLA